MKKTTSRILSALLICLLILYVTQGAFADSIYVYFGVYPQAGSEFDEPILWRIVDVYEKQAYLLSEYVLDCRRFDRTSNSWKNSAINEWLNGPFLEMAFPEHSQRSALRKAAEPDAYVFIPSLEDFLSEPYGFSADSKYPDLARTTHGTRYALQNGLSVSDGGGCSYFTRTPADNAKLISQIRGNGTAGVANCDRANIGIRPAIMLDLNWLSITGGTGTAEDPFRTQ